jgi:UDP-3-O-[3-hydroxymyristoyl] glucosamine N-acyltransferase
MVIPESWQVPVKFRQRVGAQAGIMSEVGDGEIVNGSPQMDAKDYMRSVAVFRRLPELNRLMRDLQRRLDALEQESKKP